MDFLSAVKALHEGNKICRGNNDSYFFIHDNLLYQGWNPLSNAAVPAIFCMEDYLSTDWHVYKRQAPAEKAWEEFCNGKVRMEVPLNSEYKHEGFYFIWEAAWNAAEKEFKK